MKPSTICVVGLGYIGLPTAVMFANCGHTVHGVDVNEAVLTHLNNRELPIEEPGLLERLNEAMDAERFTVSNEPVESDVFILAVPSPITEEKRANFAYIESATRSIAPVVKKGDLVILESTVPPRTVQDVVVKTLEEETDFVIGEDIFVAHSPERVIPGKVFEELVNNDRIIGGVNEQSAQMTADLYRTFVKGNMHLTDDTTAELVKVMENTYRDVNIALANELAKVAANIGVNVWEAIRLANFHPRVNIHFPGPGVGGHCIAVDPWFLVALDEVNTPLIHTARKTNDGMPQYTAKLTASILQAKAIEQPKVAALGLAFKGNIDDMRESPSLDVVHYLKEENLNVVAFDPHIQENRLPEQTQSLTDAARDASALVILTNHDAFIELDPHTVGPLMKTRVVIDTKNCIDRARWKEAGFDVYTLGNSKDDE